LAPARPQSGLMTTNAKLYVQLRFSRGGRNWQTGVSGFGPEVLAEAREMARNLSRSAATTDIEVSTEMRDGAISSDTKFYRWSSSRGWWQN